MKMLAFSAVIVTLTVVAASQSQLPLPPQRPRLMFPPLTIITADELANTAADPILARGNVKIESSSTIITADEADIRRVKNFRDAVELSIDVRGNVRVSIAPDGKR